MFAPTIMMLAAAAAGVAIDPADCRTKSSGRTGSAAWESDGKGHLSVSMDVPSAGEVSLQCRISVPAGAQTVTLSFDKALVSFQPSGSKEGPGSGLVLGLGSASCNAGLTRVTGESWIEARRRSWSVPVQVAAATPGRPGTGARSVIVRVSAVDSSGRDPVRIDLQGLRVTFEASPEAAPCP